MIQLTNFLKNIPLQFWGFILVSLILSNICFYFLAGWRWYSYTTSDGQFVFDAYPAKGRDIKMMKIWWESYKIENNPSDTTIYRTFSKNYMYVWRWLEYSRPEYGFPYIVPEKMGNKR
jgi:hypothetical protein